MNRSKSRSPALGPMGWRHCKNVIPKSLIHQIEKDLSDFMADLGAPKRGILSCNIDLQARWFRTNIAEFQLALQKNLKKFSSVYELALSHEIKSVLETNTGWKEIELSPIHNIRVKYPSRYGISPFTTVPWHQDYGATDPSQNNLDMVTAWIPLTSSNTHKGGIELIPRSTKLGWLEHRRGDRGPEVKEQILQRALKDNCDLKSVKLNTHPGDIILFDQYTLHRSSINLSNKIRWSIDMRYVSHGSESGRPGMWESNPIAGKFTIAKVMDLARQRQDSIDHSDTRIRKRVDYT